MLFLISCHILFIANTRSVGVQVISMTPSVVVSAGFMCLTQQLCELKNFEASLGESKISEIHIKVSIWEQT